MNGFAQWFWFLIVVACLVWYSTITFLVTYRGIIDIRGMLGRLRKGDSLLEDEPPDSP